jgi:hypothetical protein
MFFRGKEEAIEVRWNEDKSYEGIKKKRLKPHSTETVKYHLEQSIN